MDDDKPKRRDQKTRKTDGVRRPESRAVTTNPKQAGDADSPSLPDFGQSVEAGGVD